MSEQREWTMVTRLEYLAAGGEPQNEEYGICHDLEVHGVDLLEALDEALASHPGFTGDYRYPIPSLSSDQTPGQAFWFTPDLWVGDYGDLRRNFAAHAAAYLKERGYE